MAKAQMQREPESSNRTSSQEERGSTVVPQKNTARGEGQSSAKAKPSLKEILATYDRMREEGTLPMSSAEEFDASLEKAIKGTKKIRAGLALRR
jgi:hypothetical protein